VVPFTADEVTCIVQESPSDRVPGPDGFSGAFYKATWGVIGPDVMQVFNAFWNLDFRSFNLLNEAMIVEPDLAPLPGNVIKHRASV
jgi:hypothetical protein